MKYVLIVVVAVVAAVYVHAVKAQQTFLGEQHSLRR
jgi:hypothetical protein